MLDKRKNFELLLRTVSSIIHDGIECFLVIIGEGKLKQSLETIVKSEDIANYVLFTGFQSNPYPYFRTAKIVCVSSFTEGLPTVILEALVFGKPFVTTPVAGASDELADNGRCGLVADWNIGDYADCIKKLLTDTELYDTMSRNCTEKAKEFTMERFTTNFNNLLQGLNQE
jgi:glycosyltransferase involved in cell wall biosynthesis